MRIKSLTLAGANRLYLSGIEKITVKPETSIMSLIGTNGCGKSSLLWYLSPLPAERADFEKGGYKEIVVEQNHIEYRLTSDFKENKHSFVNLLTGEELNVGGTLTMQKDLVQSYFAYNDKIHALLTGRERFTRMSPARRKDWFSTLCDADYTFAFNVFNQAKERHRDTAGALKKLVTYLTRLSEEKTNEDIHMIVDAIGQKNKLIEEIQEAVPYKEAYGRHADGRHWEQAERSALSTLKQKTEETAQRISEVSQSQFVLSQYEKMKDELELKRNELEQKRGGYSKMIERYSELESRLNKERNDEHVARDLANDLAYLEKELSEMALDTFDSDVDTESLYRQAQQRQDEILNAISSLGEFGDEDLTRQLLQDTAATLETLRVKVSGLRGQLARAEEELNMMEKNEQRRKVACPNCDHEFHPGFQKERYEHIKGIRAKLLEDIGASESILAEGSQQYRSMQTRYSVLERFSDVVKSIAVFTPVGIAILKNKLYLGSSQRAQTEWSRYLAQLSKSAKRRQTVARLEALRTQLKHANQLDERERDVLYHEYQELQVRIQAERQAMEVLSERVSNIQTSVSLIDNMYRHAKELGEMQARAEEALTDSVEFELFLAGRSLVATLREEIATLSNIQMEQLTRSRNISETEKQINDLQVELKTWETIMDTMNPNDGLIGEGLLGFIRVFLAKANALISNIWEYPLVIHPAKLSEEKADELNYKFPITVGIDGTVRADISLGSDGICEVIDLAFRLVAANFLGLRHHPIYLDEFGRTFDAKHRENALKLIERISEEFKDDQIFMVSHSFMEYSVMSDVSFCVLSEDNIVLPPKGINQGVHIERKRQ